MLKVGTAINYRGRLHKVVGVTPIGVTPLAVELEDVDSGRVWSVPCDDPELVTESGEAPPTERAANTDV